MRLEKANAVLQGHSREKLLNAITFFVTHTKSCGKTKLYKLLYFLDFQHYTTTGRSVTDLDYYAWPKGPVPRALHVEVLMPPQDLAEAFEIENLVLKNGNEMLKIKPLRQFDGRHFSKRELGLLESLSKEFCSKNADEMVEATHLENLPWHQVYEVEGRKQERIPYELALRKGDHDAVLKVIDDHTEFEEHYGDRRDIPF